MAFQRSTESPKSPPPALTLRAPFVNGSNAFATDLWRVIAKNHGNLVLSPANISISLAMAFYGARGETAEEMARVLHFSNHSEDVVRSAHDVLQTWSSSNTPIAIRSINRLFGQPSFSYEMHFLKRIEQEFGAPLELVDFIKDPERARQRINILVAKATDYRISESIASGGIRSDTRLVLVNVIHFKAEWLAPFDAARTTRLPFYVTDTEKKSVPMMRELGTYRFADRHGVRALEMFYKGEGASMLFLLPDTANGLAELENSLTLDELERWVEAMKPERLEVTLPKFSIQSSPAVRIRDALHVLGVRQAFDPSKADFSSIGALESTAERLYIQEIFHHAFINVDEEGTEAGAGTMLVSGTGARFPVFRADHPFVFVLRDTNTGMVLFMGRVADPSTQ